MNKPLKITLIAATATGWHQRDLARAAAERNVQFETLDIKSANELPAKAKRFGDVVIWRATSGLDTFSERAAANFYFGNRPVMNKAVFVQPFITHKYFQQVLIAKQAPDVKSIRTYRATSAERLQKLIARRSLTFPFIAKPNLGSKGQDIIMVENEQMVGDITNHRNFVFQNFIPNSGDWRVIVVGGRALGVMRRIAKKGSYLNNISQGARAVEETRVGQRQKAIDIALQAAATFGLAYCGVDIIQDKSTKEYYFLEINTAPQWNGEFGFAAITGADVAREIVDLAVQLGQRSSTPAPRLVQEYYDRYITEFPSKLIHYASRMYLWTGEKKYKQMLVEAEETYLGKDAKSVAVRLQELLNKEVQIRATQPAARRTTMEQYPFLQTANRLLFKVLFARTLYGRDIRTQVRHLISDDQFLALFTRLAADHHAIRTLSTYAINFFYLLKNYFADDLKLSNLVLLNPSFFGELLSEYDDLVAAGHMTQQEAVRLQVYLVTHVIIGESQFYARPVTDPGYTTLLIQAEDIIKNNYFDLSLDSRVEFLVTAKLCGYESSLAPIILHEAARSLAPTGNFVIDTLNTANEAVYRRRFNISEHRNVLYLMASLPFALVSRKTAPSIPVRQQLVIGRLAEISFPEYGIEKALARVDTGAFFSAVHAQNIIEHDDGQLSFELLGGYSPHVASRMVTLRSYQKTEIKNTAGEYQNRYLVELPVVVAGRRSKQLFTLAERRKMACPILLGRSFLKKGYLVDVKRKF